MLSISGRRPPSRSDLLDLWSLIQANRGRQAPARLISCMEQRRRNCARWLGALLETRLPRRLICGAADPIPGAHLAGRYRELVPDADVIVLEGVGRHPLHEDPGRVAAQCGAFRRRLDAHVPRE